jgi:glucoamylase
MKLTSAIMTFADGFVEIAAKYTPSDGGLSEEYDKSTGAPLSAVDLTWSYASVLTAGASRAGVQPASWGANGLTVPAVCVGNTGPQVIVTFNVQATTQFGGACAYASNESSRIVLTEDVGRRKHIHHWFR